MKCSDFQLSVTLSALGYSVEELDRSNNERVKFCFVIDKNKSIQKAVDAFWKGEVRLEPKTLFFHQKLLKNRLFGEK